MREQKWRKCRRSDIRQQLDARGHRVSKPGISRLLRDQGCRLRANHTQAAGKQHPARDQPFAQIQAQRAAHQAAGQPVISVDTKQQELGGNFKNAGQIWCQAAEVVDAHDVPPDAVGRAVPYAIYDLQHNRGTVSVGQSADTPAVAVDNRAHGCATALRARFPDATPLLIAADRGGSNSARARVWKRCLQAQGADRFGLHVMVCHYPTGASKCTPIAHRLFSEISKTWAGCPLRSFDTVVHDIADTRTQTGLEVTAHLVPTLYPKGAKVPDAVMATLNLEAHAVCPQWNYTIHPRPIGGPSRHDQEVILL